MLNKYIKVSNFNENEDYYHDWYDEGLFSLAEKSSGECSAGLFDLIELDLETASEGLTKFVETTNQITAKKIMRDIIHSLSRALLITKGLEPKDDEEAVNLFKENFIGKHLDNKWNSIINK